MGDKVGKGPGTVRGCGRDGSENEDRKGRTARGGAGATADGILHKGRKRLIALYS